jgi:hypothetical protein
MQIGRSLPRLQRSVTDLRLTQQKVIAVNSAIKLLKAQRSSAQVDARKMEAQLARLDRSAASGRIRTYLRYVVRLFRDYIRTLDEDIKSARRLRG